ncbi:MAG TPA: FkbM family methyltransferase [Chitinophagaceae bacterium]|nr:FkbM family methyltransferase [Chitinophagaceae bacterium]
MKHFLFGNGVQEKRIFFGKAKGIRLCMDPNYNAQKIIGSYEHEIQSVFVKQAKRSDCFFDIGAAEGYYSLLYKKYNPLGEVYLFDIDKNLRSVQEAHFALNKIADGFHLYFKSVSDKNDEWQISPDSLHIKNNKVLIKVDVEGAESVVLRGMNHLLKENDCWLIIETHSKQLEKDCMSFLTQHGYHTKIINNAWWRFFIPERRPLSHNRWLAAWR